MGWIPCIGFSLGGSKGRPAADHIEEPAGYDGEWVTLVARGLVGRAVTYRRRNRTIFATREEALKEARRAIKNKMKWTTP